MILHVFYVLAVAVATYAFRSKIEAIVAELKVVFEKDEVTVETDVKKIL